MSERIQSGGLSISRPLHEVIQSALIGSGLSEEGFWQSLAHIAAKLGPSNRHLLAKREALQSSIDDWHRTNLGKPDPADYRSFL